MGKVIHLPRRVGARTDTAATLARLSAQEEAGELQGSILIARTKSGTEFHVLGTCAERLQLAVLAMVKGLNIVTDKIVATGAVGNTRSDSVNASWPAPKRRLRKRLQEVTKMGELE